MTSVSFRDYFSFVFYSAHVDCSDWDEGCIQLNNDVCSTDGSRINNTDMSCAIVYNYTNGEELSFPTGQFCSVFETEIYAVLRCTMLESLCSRDNTSIVICSDSQAALKVLASTKVISALVTETV